MNQSAVRHAGNPESSARETATPHVKCTRPFVPSAAQKLKYLLSHVRVGQFIVAIVLTRQKQQRVKNQLPLTDNLLFRPESLLCMEGLFFS
jgi:hypothetical protein